MTDVTTDDTGSVSENEASQASESADTSSPQERMVSALDLVEREMVAENSSGETETTPASSKPDGDWVPRSRLNEVIAKRREAEAKLAEATAREAELSEAGKAEQIPDAPPPGLSEDEQAAWFVKKHAKNYVEGELGMSLADAKTLLSTAQTTSKDYAQRRWESECKSRGIDPANQEAAQLVAGLVKGSGVSLADAFSRAQKFYGGQQATQQGEPDLPRQAASVESGGQTGVMTAERKIPRDAHEAVEMAKKGQRAPALSSAEIIRSAIEAGKDKKNPVLRTF